MDPVKIGANPLTLKDVYDVAVLKRRVNLSTSAQKKILRAQTFLKSQISSGNAIYGVNTGFGILSQVRIPDDELENLQVNLIRSHACGTGPALSDEAVRAIVFLRAVALALGHSGVSVELVEILLEFLNRGVCPTIFEQGSVGASGDLAPLAHLALVIIGEGSARVGGKELGGTQALRSVGLKPLQLGPKEGLALINGTQFMSALGALNLLDAEYLCQIGDLAGAISLEAFRGTQSAFEPEIHKLRPHPGQIQTAENLRKILGGRNIKSTISKSHENCGKVQDPYSFRCMPQVHGATRDSLRFVREVLEREINSVTDNPLIFPTSGKIISGGNFHGQIVAIAMDLLAIAMAEIASISEQRIEKLINPALSDLPAFLTKVSGINSGMMIVQVAAASIVSENKTLCHPASVDSIPTSADKEDHVSMGAWAARKAGKVIENTRRVLAMELLCGTQGIDLLRPLRSSDSLEKIHKIIRKKVPKLGTDRAFYSDIAQIEKLLKSHDFKTVVDELFN